jgi:Fic family protein
MKWNWQLQNWPKFSFEPDKIVEMEKQFLLSVGESVAFLKSISSEDRKQFIIEILSQEGFESSKIEGEILERESLQSSIKKHFGLKNSFKQNAPKEAGMANLLCDIYESFSDPLSHEMLYKWHSMLFDESNKSIECGKYRSFDEPMQIVSHRYDRHEVFFEAPPSNRIYSEMEVFIDWFNSIKTSDSIFVRAAIAHVYFESIHPFEDGNGRIGRALVEKVLSQGVGKPILIAVSKVLEKNKKNYYAELGKCNHTLDIQDWIGFFSNIILKAQQESIDLLNFLIEKTKLLLNLSSDFNHRQEKVLLRMFSEGLEGFKGGLSAENYIKITKTSRATATRDLADLVKMGALFKTGELRYTRYWLNIKKRKNLLN